MHTFFKSVSDHCRGFGVIIKIENRGAFFTTDVFLILKVT